MKTFQVEAINKKSVVVLKSLLGIDRRKGLVAFVVNVEPYIVRFQTNNKLLEKNVSFVDFCFMMNLVFKAHGLSSKDYKVSEVL